MWKNSWRSLRRNAARGVRSVTGTALHIGRLLQNMLMSFAEFEREQIAATTAHARLEIVNGSQLS
jgi:DNA invertase Pin-like site-specific DNA recombinase